MKKSTQALHALGQSLWLDNITRQLLNDGTLARYIEDFDITGLTSNPTIFEKAIGKSTAYDEQIAALTNQGKSGEVLFFELALQDLTLAADLFRPVFDSTDGADGWVSLEVSPLLAHDAAGTIAAAADLHARAARPNLFIKIPGTAEGMEAIEQTIFAGIPVNVTLLFSPRQYRAAAEAYLRGIERRIERGLDPRVRSVASIFVSRWDVAANQALPKTMHNQLGLAIAEKTYQAWWDFQGSARWIAAANAGAQKQRMLWASTGVKDSRASDTMYVERLVAPDTINTMPEATLLAFVDHGRGGAAMPIEGSDAEPVLADCRAAGIDVTELAQRLQVEGADAFTASWTKLLAGIAAKVKALAPEPVTGGSA